MKTILRSLAVCHLLLAVAVTLPAAGPIILPPGAGFQGNTNPPAVVPTPSPGTQLPNTNYVHVDGSGNILWPGNIKLPAENLTGTIPDARLSANVTLLGPTIDVGGAEITGTLKAGSFPALTGDVTTSAGSLATTIANDAVSNAKLANMAQDRIKGRVSSGTGDPEDLTAEQVKEFLDLKISDFDFSELTVSLLTNTGDSHLLGDVHITGSVEATLIGGDGRGLTNLNASSLNEWPFVPLFVGGSGGSFGADTFGRQAALWNATANATWNSYAPAEMWSATGKSNVVLRVYVSTGTNGTYNFNVGVSWWTATNAGFAEKVVPITVDDTKQVTLVTATNTITVPPEQVLGVRAQIYTSNPGSVVGLVGGTVCAQ